MRSVRRPRWPTIVRAGALRQVAEVALFGWNSKDLTARFEGRASASRRKRRIANHARDFLELRSRPREIAGHFDVELLRLTGFRVDEINVTRLLVHDRIRAGRSSHDIEIIVMRDLRQLLRVSAISKQINRVIAIREKVDRVPDPHRK